jgi:hypothetical protein
MPSHSPLFSLAVLASALASFGAEHSPVFLSANNLSIATGQPSLVLMSSGSTHIPVWSLSGGTVGQSVAGVVAGLPSDCTAVKVEITVTSTDAETSPEFQDVYRVHLSQMVENAPFTERYALGKPVRTALPAAPFHSRTIVLESCYEVVPDAPLTVRIQREPGDPGDTFTKPTGLAAVKVTPQPALHEAARRSGRERLQFVADDSGHRREAGLRVWPWQRAHHRQRRSRSLRAHFHRWRKNMDRGNRGRRRIRLRRGRGRQRARRHRRDAALGAPHRKKRMEPRPLPQHRRHHVHARRDAEARRAPDADHGRLCRSQRSGSWPCGSAEITATSPRNRGA